MTREKARQLRAKIEQAAVSLPDEDAIEVVELFPHWQADTAYNLAERIRYGEKLYKCIQAHTSQAGWEPPNVPALWTEVAKPGDIPVWKQPTGSQDAYMTGDKVWYPERDTTVYICMQDYNVYAPNVWGWEVYR